MEMHTMLILRDKQLFTATNAQRVWSLSSMQPSAEVSRR
jgi:hypothetical protein